MTPTPSREERLAEALRPFAESANYWDANKGKGALFPDDHIIGQDMTVGDLRRARAALSPVETAPANPGGEPSEGAADAASAAYAINSPPPHYLVRPEAIRAALRAANAVDFPKPEDGAFSGDARLTGASLEGIRTEPSAPSSGPSLSDEELDRLQKAAEYAGPDRWVDVWPGFVLSDPDDIAHINASNPGAVLRLIALIRASKVPPAPSVSSGPIPTEADLERLEKIRAAATQGEWRRGKFHNANDCDTYAVLGPDGEPMHSIEPWGFDFENATFVVAFKPQAMAPVLSLAREGLRARWMPIESAPKDGTDFLALIPWQKKHHQMAGCFAPDGKFHSWPARLIYGPTHWMPLPTPPVAAAPPAPGGK